MIKIHPFDLFDKINKSIDSDVITKSNHCTVLLDGVEYMDDRSMPYDIELAKANGLIQ